IDYARKRGDSRRMEALAHQLLRVDNLSEDAARAQLEGRAMAGDRIGALRLFDRWRARLADELGALPSPPIGRMADRLRRNNWERPPAAAPAPVLTERWQERTFIGRGAEFSACYDVWEHVRNSETRHILLRGDTGIGKTTLVERFATSVALEGASVARMKCYALERELPFGTIGGLVGHLLELPGASATPPEHLAELGRLVGKVRQRYPSLPPPAPSVGETARMLFTEAVMALVTAIADEHPVVLVVDDIHLADATSLAVLHLMLRRISDLPLLVVLTSSSALQDETPDARRFVDSAESIALTQLHLDPLPAREAAELLDALMRHSANPGPTLRRAMLAGARGNPMVLELLVCDWRRCGDDCLALSLGAMTTIARTPPEEAFRRVVEHTLVDLDAESRSVAELGAILGQRLNDLSMYTLVDLPVARTMRAMTSLAAQRILRDAGNTLEFTNEFVRGQCYVAMAAPLRRMLHGSVADRLLAQDGADAPIPGLEIAWHLVRADRLVEAVPYLLAGGREAICRAAPHEADLALSTGLPALTGGARRTATLLLAEAQQELGRWADSLQLLDLANEPFTESEQAGRDVFRIIARKRLEQLSPAQVRESTKILLDIAASEADLEVTVKALAATPPMLNVTRDEAQIDTLERLLSERGGSYTTAFQHIHVLHARAWMLAIRHSNSAALQEVTRAVAIAEEASVASSIVVRLLIGMGGILAGVGRYDDAQIALEKAAILADRLDNDLLQGECACGLALTHGRLGRADLQITYAQQGLQRYPQTEWSSFMVSASYELGLGLVAEERYHEAQSAVAPLTTKPTADVPLWLIQAGLLYAADVLAMSGNVRRAYTVARRATTGSLSNLFQAACAGLFSRWVALLGIRDQQVRQAHERLASAFPRTETLDCRDQVEVLAAVTTLEFRLGADPTIPWNEVRQRLSTLPVSVTTIMRRTNAVVGVESSLFELRP
ncbi:MAG: ATP-binding protein, partial [Gemmatimonadales bacterium]